MSRAKWAAALETGTLDPDFEQPAPWIKQGAYIPTTTARTEADLQIQVAAFLKRCYPQVLFQHDAHAAVNVHINTALKAKAMGARKGWPDLNIALPRGGYPGLYLELKKPGLRLFKKKDGAPYNEHFAEQLSIHERLRAAGYFVAVVQTLEAAVSVVDAYMSEDGETLKQYIKQ